MKQQIATQQISCCDDEGQQGTHKAQATKQQTEGGDVACPTATAAQGLGGIGEAVREIGEEGREEKQQGVG